MGFSGLTRILLGKPGEKQGLKEKGRIPTDDLISKNRLCRNHHLMTFQIPSAITNAILIAFSLRLSRCRMILYLLSPLGTNLLNPLPPHLMAFQIPSADTNAI